MSAAPALAVRDEIHGQWSGYWLEPGSSTPVTRPGYRPTGAILRRSGELNASEFLCLDLVLVETPSSGFVWLPLSEAGRYTYAHSLGLLRREPGWRLFCAEDGGIDPAGVATDGELQPDVEVLRAIRNVVLHPASQLAKGNKPPPMPRLIGLLEADDDASVTELALRLPDDWSYLAERPIATYALRKLGSAGELFLEKMRLLAKRSPGLSR